MIPAAASQAPKPDAALERERLVSLINSMADGVIATDETASVVLYNGAALNILDLNASMQGKPIASLCHLIDKNNQPADLTKIVLGSKIALSRRDLKLKYSDGSAINVYLSIAPVRLGFGQKGMKGYVLLLRDITREKSLEEERDEFISVVSHELRTPIAIAEGNVSNAQLMLDKSSDFPKLKLALSQAHDQINFLGDMINDLATLARAERGKLTVEVEPINIHELVKGLVNIYAPGAAVKGLKVAAELDPRLELLNTSKLYLREILQNFITNAIKYTTTGGITVNAAPKDKGVLFKVTDTGIGISRQDHEKIFDKFFRSEDYRTRAHTGTGLGLYVTMKLATLIHADINFTSELNKGSVFSVYVPNMR